MRPASLTSRLGWLDTIITIAPLLGLLGTVTGMISAFHVIATKEGISTPTAITGGVAEALIATATGLAIAIFTLSATTHLQERIKQHRRGDRGTRHRDGQRARGHRGVRQVKLRAYQPKKARIEIIPMIDTIFFLLVFFMIASLAMTTAKGMPVNLPKASAATERPVVKVVLTLTQSGSYYVDKQRVELRRA